MAGVRWSAGMPRSTVVDVYWERPGAGGGTPLADGGTGGVRDNPRYSSPYLKLLARDRQGRGHPNWRGHGHTRETPTGRSPGRGSATRWARPWVRHLGFRPGGPARLVAGRAGPVLRCAIQHQEPSGAKLVVVVRARAAAPAWFHRGAGRIRLDDRGDASGRCSGSRRSAWAYAEVAPDQGRVSPSLVDKSGELAAPGV